jgi:hypothetical protein
MKQQPDQEELSISPLPCWYCGRFQHTVIGFDIHSGLLLLCQSCGIVGSIVLTKQTQIKKLKSRKPNYV